MPDSCEECRVLRAEVAALRARLPVDGSHMPSVVDLLEDEVAELRAEIQRLKEK
jgi:hypothetical protein